MGCSLFELRVLNADAGRLLNWQTLVKVLPLESDRVSPLTARFAGAGVARGFGDVEQIFRLAKARQSQR